MKATYTKTNLRGLLCAALVTVCPYLSHAQAVRDVQQVIELPQQGQSNTTLTKTQDGGYFLISWYYTTGTTGPVAYKLNADLSVAWHHPMELPTPYGGMFQVTDVKECSDGEFIACGRLINEGAYGGAYLLKLDASGNVKWLRRYNESVIFNLNSVVETRDGFISVGSAPGVNLYDGLIMGTDRDGAALWVRKVQGQKTWSGYPGMSGLSQIIDIGGQEFAAVGTVNMQGGEADAVVLRFNDIGGMNGAWVYGDNANGYATSYETGVAIKYVPDEDALVLTGRAMSGSASVCGDVWYSDIWVWKTGAQDGALHWSNRYNNANADGAFENKFSSPADLDCDNGQIGVTGVIMNYTELTASYTYDPFIFRLDQSGNAFNNRLYTQDNSNFLSRIIRTGQQSYVAGGQTWYNGFSQVKLVESYDNILELCNMEEPPFEQNPLDISVLDATITNAMAESVNMELGHFDYAFKEQAICERKLLGNKPGNNTGLPLVQKEAALLIRADRTVVFTAAEHTTVPVTIIDATGRVLRRSTVRNGDKIELAGLSAGVYFLKADMDGKTVTRKIAVTP